MAELQQALQLLAPIDWSDVPQDDLPTFLSERFQAAELLCNSVPPPANGTPFDSSQTKGTVPNFAKCAADMHASSVRAPAREKAHEDLQKHWGKPQKFNKKSNPLDVALYKMAGDRRGAWFARHSVLEGLGFERFKRAMMREFPDTLLEEGPPGSGAKRGLSADQRVEDVEVPGVGRMQAYQLSGLMPAPVSTREFVTLLMSTEDGLSNKSGIEVGAAEKHAPRHFMVVSKPLNHPETPNRANFVKGQYESVELIREIPLHASKARSGEGDDPELNPVEWIMITRSDPGGGIPRFLVDRGTPEAMLGDVTKFLDWACTLNDDEAPASEQQSSEHEVNGTQTGDETRSPGIDGTSTDAHATEATAQLEKQTSHAQSGEREYSDDTSDTSSIDSFMSAEEMRRMSTAPENPDAAKSSDDLSIRSANSNLSSMDRKNMSQHDKDVQKIMQQRERLDQKLAKKRMAEENRLKQSEQKEESERDKAKERMEKEMKKTEDKHKRELEKLEAKREKEARKTEDRRKKREEQNKISQVARERDQARSQLELYRKENELLVDQIESLQRENTMLTGKVGKLGGSEAIKSVQDEIAGLGRKRAGTVNTTDSRVSLESGGSGTKKDAAAQ